jgi:hypothetical protein
MGSSGKQTDYNHTAVAVAAVILALNAFLGRNIILNR